MSESAAVAVQGADMVFNAGRPNEVRALEGIDLVVIEQPRSV